MSNIEKRRKLASNFFACFSHIAQGGELNIYAFKGLFASYLVNCLGKDKRGIAKDYPLITV